MRLQLCTALLVISLGCQPMDRNDDLATQASGKYFVALYIVDNDTITIQKSIAEPNNKDPYIEISKVSNNRVRITNYSFKNGSFCGISNDAQVASVEGRLKLSIGVNPPSLYESTIHNGVLYQRTIGMNTDSLFNRLRTDSLKSAYAPPNREVIISAIRR